MEPRRPSVSFFREHTVAQRNPTASAVSGRLNGLLVEPNNASKQRRKRCRSSRQVPRRFLWIAVAFLLVGELFPTTFLSFAQNTLLAAWPLPLDESSSSTRLEGPSREDGGVSVSESQGKDAVSWRSSIAEEVGPRSVTKNSRRLLRTAPTFAAPPLRERAIQRSASDLTCSTIQLALRMWASGGIQEVEELKKKFRARANRSTGDRAPSGAAAHKPGIEAEQVCSLLRAWRSPASLPGGASPPSETELANSTAFLGYTSHERSQPQSDETSRGDRLPSARLEVVADTVCAASEVTQASRNSRLLRALAPAFTSQGSKLRQALPAAVRRDRERQCPTVRRAGYALLDALIPPPAGLWSFARAAERYRETHNASSSSAADEPSPESSLARPSSQSPSASSASRTFATLSSLMFPDDDVGRVPFREPTEPPLYGQRFSTESPASRVSDARAKGSETMQAASDLEERGVGPAFWIYSRTVAPYLAPLFFGLILICFIPFIVFFSCGACWTSTARADAGCMCCKRYRISCLRVCCLVRRPPLRPPKRPSGSGSSVRLVGDLSAPAARAPRRSGRSFGRHRGDSALRSASVRSSSGTAITTAASAAHTCEWTVGGPAAPSAWVPRPAARVLGLVLLAGLLVGVGICLFLAIVFSGQLIQAVDDIQCAVSAALVQVVHGGAPADAELAMEPANNASATRPALLSSRSTSVKARASVAKLYSPLTVSPWLGGGAAWMPFRPEGGLTSSSPPAWASLLASQDSSDLSWISPTEALAPARLRELLPWDLSATGTLSDVTALLSRGFDDPAYVEIIIHHALNLLRGGETEALEERREDDRAEHKEWDADRNGGQDTKGPEEQARAAKPLEQVVAGVQSKRESASRSFAAREATRASSATPVSESPLETTSKRGDPGDVELGGDPGARPRGSASEPPRPLSAPRRRLNAGGGERDGFIVESPSSHTPWLDSAAQDAARWARPGPESLFSKDIEMHGNAAAAVGSRRGGGLPGRHMDDKAHRRSLGIVSQRQAQPEDAKAIAEVLQLLAEPAAVAGESSVAGTVAAPAVDLAASRTGAVDFPHRAADFGERPAAAPGRWKASGDPRRLSAASQALANPPISRSYGASEAQVRSPVLSAFSSSAPGIGDADPWASAEPTLHAGAARWPSRGLPAGGGPRQEIGNEAPEPTGSTPRPPVGGSEESQNILSDAAPLRGARAAPEPAGLPRRERPAAPPEEHSAAPVAASRPGGSSFPGEAQRLAQVATVREHAVHMTDTVPMEMPEAVLWDVRGNASFRRRKGPAHDVEDESKAPLQTENAVASSQESDAAGGDWPEETTPDAMPQGGFAGLKPSLETLKRMEELADAQSPRGLRQPLLDAATSALNVEGRIEALHEHWKTMQDMLSHAANGASGPVHDAFHRSTAFALARPAFDLLVPKDSLRRNLRQLQAKSHEALLAVRDFEKGMRGVRERYALDEIDAAVEGICDAASDGILLTSKVKKPTTAAMHVFAALAGAFLGVAIIYLALLCFRWTPKSTDFSPCPALLLWPVALLLAVATIFFGATLLVASVVQVDGCFFVAREVQHRGVLEALVSSLGSWRGNAEGARAAAAVAKACFADSPEEEIDRNLTKALDLGGFSGLVRNFESSLRSVADKVDLRSIDALLAGVAVAHALVHDTAWAFFLDTDALEAAGLSYRTNTYLPVLYSGLQDKARTFRSLFDVPAAQLIGPPGLRREDLFTLPPTVEPGASALEAIQKEWKRLKAKHQRVRDYTVGAESWEESGDNRAAHAELGKSASPAAETGGQQTAGRFLLYGLVDVEEYISPFYLEALHRGEPGRDPKYEIDDFFSVDTPDVQAEIARLKPDAETRIQFENALWLASLKQRLRTAGTRDSQLSKLLRGCARDAETPPPTAADRAEAMRPSPAACPALEDVNTLPQPLPLPFRCSIKQPLRDEDLESVRRQEANRAADLRARLDADDHRVWRDEEKQKPEGGGAILLPYAREWQDCAYDRWIDLLEGQEASAMILQAHALYAGVHNSWQAAEATVLVPAVDAMDRARLILNNVDCAPVFRSLQTVQRLVCHDGAESLVLLSVCYLFLGLAALTLFVGLFCVWQALVFNHRERKRCLNARTASALPLRDRRMPSRGQSALCESPSNRATKSTSLYARPPPGRESFEDVSGSTAPTTSQEGAQNRIAVAHYLYSPVDSCSGDRDTGMGEKGERRRAGSAREASQRIPKSQANSGGRQSLLLPATTEQPATVDETMWADFGSED
ncbi:hypothetical protein BESB_032870 [Besnoitia besnoiti]|uniref:Transmembrane protein n=1 Tax=Besnoitia besnoiti TaxID=94643 RepID=A0A2A9M6P5_BESBE|nr:uncharacterized protein BESB_032870 [Besnoitia besnoiti]PFH31090.1 hypothetical protein BESB_032870 [Besnoitia besnoiti]